MHEAQLADSACFVTLTYEDAHLPPNGALVYRDFQLFMKRLRAAFPVRPGGQKPIRFFMCGEYGPLNLRPHYHACLFNIDFRSDWIPAGKSAAGAVFYSSRRLSNLWGLGFATVQALNKSTAGYTARYVMKKVLGQEAELAYSRSGPDGPVQVPAEFCRMSLKPAIGQAWFDKYWRDVFPHDFVVLDGAKYPPPKAYDRMLKRALSAARREGRVGPSVDLDAVEFAREGRARDAAPDNSPARRAVREQVHLARIRNLKREGF